MDIFVKSMKRLLGKLMKFLESKWYMLGEKILRAKKRSGMIRPPLNILYVTVLLLSF